MTEIQKQKEKLKKQTAEEIGNQAVEKMRKTKKRKIKSGLDKGEPSNEGKKKQTELLSCMQSNTCFLQ